MIIQCDHCSARFKMDDSKLANGPVKVRCAKCKEVFIVRPEESAAETAPYPATATAPSAASTTNAQDESEPREGQDVGGDADFFSGPPPASSDSPTKGEDDFSFDFEAPSDGGKTEPEESSSAENFDWKEKEPDAEAESSAFNLSDFDSSLAVPAGPAAVPATPGDDNDFDFGEVNFGSGSSTDVNAGARAEKGADSSPEFGEVSFSDQSGDSLPDARPANTPGQGSLSADFADWGADDLSTTDFSGRSGSETDRGAQTEGSKGSRSEEADLADFRFGELDTSGAKASESPGPSEINPATVDIAESDSALTNSDEDIHPSSVASRKKSGSLFPVTVIVGAILLIIVLAGAGVYFFGGPKAFSKIGLGFLVEWYGEKGVEEGKIALKDVTASYVVNSSAGELFVVRGEAVNNFSKPRASIQIKVSLLGSGGTVLTSKSAYCGNSLSPEQLASLPLAKIDEAMNNQFGDSLANLGLKPGQAIPFVVVISAVHKDATDYTVQVSGSTVATQ